jgi:two-component system sensor histidine kinase PilS (NtrC family)
MTSPAPAVASVAAAGLARRLTWLMLVRTLVISAVLGLSLWLGSGQGTPMAAPAERFLLGVVVATYAATIGFALLLRRGVAPARLVWPQLAGDLAITTALTYVTGGAQSAYTSFFALSVVGAGAITDRRGAWTVGAVAIALTAAVGVAAWARLAPLPTIPQVEPWTQSGRELALAISRSVGALIAVGVLAALFVGELERSQASLVSQRQVTADLVALNRDIVRSLSSGLVTVGPDDRVLTINQTGAEILGPVAAGAIGEPVETVLPGLAARLAGVGATATVRRADLTLPRQPPRTVGISVSPLFDDGDHVIGRVRTRSATRWRRSRARSSCSASRRRPPTTIAR